MNVISKYLQVQPMAALCIENTSEFAMNRLFAMEATAAEPQQTQSVEGTEELKQQIEQLKLQLQTQNKVLEDEKTKRAAIEKHLDFVLHARDGALSSFQPVGVIRSVYRDMRNIPRQGNIVPNTMARIEFGKEMQPEHSLDGLEQFSHVWILFVFNQNSGLVRIQQKQNTFKSGAFELSVKAKVKPPRLQGASVGVFSTRSPHRPVPLGMTVAKIVSVDKAKGVVHIKGIDLADKTPVIDIKPYIPRYDSIPDAVVPAWINEGALRDPAQVSVSQEARAMLDKLPLQFYTDKEEMLTALKQVLSYDIRSIYHRNKPVAAVLASSSCSSSASEQNESSSASTSSSPRKSPRSKSRSPSSAKSPCSSPSRKAASTNEGSTFELHFDDVLCHYRVLPDGHVSIVDFMPAPENVNPKFNFRIVTPGLPDATSGGQKKEKHAGKKQESKRAKKKAKKETEKEAEKEAAQ